MIILLFAFIYVFIITYSWGRLFQRLLRIETAKESNFTSISITSVLGLIALSTVGSFVSLAWRINWEFQVIVFAISLTSIIFIKPFKEINIFKSETRSNVLVLTVSFFLAFVVILYATSSSVKNPDTGIYHAQAIRWIESYPAIPGLANIHQRLGYNSSWIMVNAIFSFSFLGKQSFHFMTGYLILITTAYFFDGFKNVLGKSGSINDYVKTILLVSMFVFMLDQASSPGTDIPAAIFVGISMCEAIEMFEKGDTHKNSRIIFLIILVSYCLTVKLSTVPIILVALPFIFNSLKYRQTKQLWSASLSALTVITPFMLRNMVLSGYLVFPGMTFSPIILDWRLPTEIVQRESKVIKWFATLPNSSMERYESLSFRAWSREWFLNLNYMHRFLICINIVFPFFMLTLFTVKSWRAYIKKNIPILYLLGASISGVIFWFFSAPAIRFGLGFLLTTIAIYFAFFIPWMIGKIPINRKLLMTCFILGSLSVILLIFTRSISLSSFERRITSIKAVIISPRDYPVWSTSICEFKNFEMLCANEYNSCWYDPFPCVTSADPNVEMRSADIQDGFRYIP